MNITQTASYVPVQGGWATRLVFCLDVCLTQAVAVRNFVIEISSFARNQSSSS